MTVNLYSRLLFVVLFLTSVNGFAQTEVIKSSTTTTTAHPAEYQDPSMDNAMSKTTTTTTTTTVKSPDDLIVSAIYDKYAKEPALIGTTLTAVSQNGIVTVNGTVTAQSQADAAIDAAKKIAGVNDVRSNINVVTNPDLNTGSMQSPNY